MSGIVYKPDEAATQMLGRTTEMMKFVEGLAATAARSAQAIAPVLTGAYKDSIRSEARILEGKATGLVIAEDFKAAWIEFGTETNPTYAPLRKGAEAAGLTVRAK